MSFSTFSFVFFFLPIVLAGYYLIGKRSFTVAKYWLLAAGCFLCLLRLGVFQAG